MSFSIDDLNADYYDLRKITTVGDSLCITLPRKECRKYGLTKETEMRVISKEGVFVVLREKDYQRFSKLQRRIEKLFEEEKV